MTYHIEGDVQRVNTNRSYFRTDMQPLLLAVIVDDEDGDRISLSRWPDEDQWVADSLIRGNGYPVFVHSDGERTTSLRTLTDEGLVAALNEAVAGIEG